MLSANYICCMYSNALQNTFSMEANTTSPAQKLTYVHVVCKTVSKQMREQTTFVVNRKGLIKFHNSEFHPVVFKWTFYSLDRVFFIIMQIWHHHFSLYCFLKILGIVVKQYTCRSCKFTKKPKRPFVWLIYTSLCVCI